MSEPIINLIIGDTPFRSDGMSSQSGTSTSSRGSEEHSPSAQSDESRFRNFDNTVSGKQFDTMHVPIVGYEVMEERSKFTVFKLRVENQTSRDYWFVFRRYTDFVRLHAKLKLEFPHLNLVLPKKKWFGDNFSSTFLEERIEGLQDLINTIVKTKEMTSSSCVKDFFCLEEPPTYVDSIEESRAVIEALEERIFHLKKQLREKELENEKLKQAHSVEIEAKLRLATFVQECTKECQPCAVRLSNMDTTGMRRSD